MGKKRRPRRTKSGSDATRRVVNRGGERADMAFKQLVGAALASRHPISLLGLASLAMYPKELDPLTMLSGARRGWRGLDDILTGLIGMHSRESTALLAVVAELLVDDGELQLRCRKELAQRDERLPQWIVDLPYAEAYRAVRITDVLGDVDELVIALRLKGRQELTAVLMVDHNLFSTIVDSRVSSEPIDDVIARAVESDADVRVIEMELAEAHAWANNAFAQPTVAPETDTWPTYRALAEWMLTRLPEVREDRMSKIDSDLADVVCHSFFATDSAAPFSDPQHQDLLLELIETGHGDPLRWSAARVERALKNPPMGFGIPLEVMLDAPDLLRVFVPFAHAQSGIRDEVTCQALAAIDRWRMSYKRGVLARSSWELGDAV